MTSMQRSNPPAAGRAFSLKAGPSSHTSHWRALTVILTSNALVDSWSGTRASIENRSEYLDSRCFRLNSDHRHRATASKQTFHSRTQASLTALSLMIGWLQQAKRRLGRSSAYKNIAEPLKVSIAEKHECDLLNGRCPLKFHHGDCSSNAGGTVKRKMINAR